MKLLRVAEVMSKTEYVILFLGKIISFTYTMQTQLIVNVVISYTLLC